MALEIETTIEDGYMRVAVAGQHDLNASKNLFAQLFGECVRHELTGMLFDVRSLRGDISLVDRYAFGEFLGSQQVGSIRIAFLASEAQFWSDKFLETVAVNRGAVVLTTMDPDEALAWVTNAGAND